MTEPEVDEVGAERIPDLEPLWAALQEHHAELEDVPPVRSLADSWTRRREQYERWMTNGSGCLLLAERAGRAVGYLMLRMGDGPPTWAVDKRVAEIETLAVLADERSSGVGGALVEAALARAAAAGIRAVGVGVAHSNAGALRFYERNGFKPFYVQLLRVAE